MTLFRYKNLPNEPAQKALRYLNQTQKKYTFYKTQNYFF